MNEQAGALDFGEGAANYVDAVFANLQREVVDPRNQRAQQTRAALL